MWRRTTVLTILFLALACEDATGPEAEGQFQLAPLPQIIIRGGGVRDSLVGGTLVVEGDEYTIAVARHRITGDLAAAVDTLRAAGRARGDYQPGGCGDHYQAGTAYITAEGSGIVGVRLDLFEYATSYWQRRVTVFSPRQ